VYQKLKLQKHSEKRLLNLQKYLSLKKSKKKKKNSKLKHKLENNVNLILYQSYGEKMMMTILIKTNNNQKIKSNTTLVLSISKQQTIKLGIQEKLTINKNGNKNKINKVKKK